MALLSQVKWLISSCVSACRYVGGKISAALRSGDEKEKDGEKKEAKAAGGQCMLKKGKAGKSQDACK